MFTQGHAATNAGIRTNPQPYLSTCFEQESIHLASKHMTVTGQGGGGEGNDIFMGYLLTHEIAKS